MVKKRILTGDRPTGPLHLGHFVGSVANRVRLQDEYETFIIIADMQMLTTHFDHPERLHKDVLNVAMDNLASGVDPAKSVLFVQSMVPEIAELTVIYSNLVTVQQLSHNPTIKTEAAQYSFGESMPYGFLGYQAPHIEQARKIVRKFNATYAEVLVEPEGMLEPKLVGLDGNTKMSKSLGNAINLSDPPEEVKRKVNTAVTDPARIHPTDKGHPDVCVVFAYHGVFNKETVADIEARCKAGTIGCVPCKKLLVENLTTLLGPIRDRRAALERDPDKVFDILLQGTRRAREEGAKTMDLVREAMKIRYFPFPHLGR
jgi:tryptophanyl-tRNA synthetase